MNDSRGRNRFYAALAAKLPRIRFHDQRHTFGTPLRTCSRSVT
jgi:hypothetical protein